MTTWFLAAIATSHRPLGIDFELARRSRRAKSWVVHHVVAWIAWHASGGQLSRSRCCRGWARMHKAPQSDVRRRSASVVERSQLLRSIRREATGSASAVESLQPLRSWSARRPWHSCEAAGLGMHCGISSSKNSLHCLLLVLLLLRLRLLLLLPLLPILPLLLTALPKRIPQLTKTTPHIP